jgi:hypothetical protein
MTDLIPEAVDLLRATHQRDDLTYGRISDRLRRMQFGAAMTRELAELLICVLRVHLRDDDTAVLEWLDEFAEEWLRLKDENHGDV